MSKLKIDTNKSGETQHVQFTTDDVDGFLKGDQETIDAGEARRLRSLSLCVFLPRKEKKVLKKKGSREENKSDIVAVTTAD